MNYEEFWLLREIGTGIIGFLLSIISYALGVFIWDHRVSLTVEDREARDAAIGLVVIFGALTVRALDLWLSVAAERKGWTDLGAWVGSPWVYSSVLIFTIVGVMLTVRAFHPWPIWAILIGTAVGVPVGVSLL